jgi:hypothetical protein
MRGFIRTLRARTVAMLLALLAASPLTAPFMTCDWSDLGHVRSDMAVHVSRHAVTAPDVKTPADLNTATFAVAVTTAPAGDGSRHKSSPLPAAPDHAPVRVLVLRI